jgi:hypothetical protein
MHISKITVGRLYNLGNYEHIRYELTAEIPDGESAATALIGIENILNALNPKRPFGCPTFDDIRRQDASLRLVEAESDHNFEHRYGSEKSQYLANERAKLAENMKRQQEWDDKQKRARFLLQDLAGAANYKDAKLEWDDES